MNPAFACGFCFAMMGWALSERQGALLALMTVCTLIDAAAWIGAA